jgi:arginine/ornithine transport system substrate-binding protein
MKKIVITTLVILVLAVMVGVSTANEWKTLRVGVEGAYPPFSWVKPDGKMAGFDVDISYALCKAMGADECVLVQQDWDGIIPALLSKKYDCIVASMGITEDRKKKVAFTNKYYQSPAKFVVKKGTIKDISAKSLSGKTIGVQRATIYYQYLKDNHAADVKIKLYANQDEAYLDLKSGRLDGILADSVAVKEGFLNKPEGKDYEFIGPDLTEPKWFGDGNGIACRKEDVVLVKKLNEAIAKIRADGTYKNIQDKYFDFNIYGD